MVAASVAERAIAAPEIQRSPESGRGRGPLPEYGREQFITRPVPPEAQALINRLERASVFDASEQADLRRQVHMFIGAFSSMYARFIPQETIENAAALPERTFAVDTATFNDVIQSWGKKPKSNYLAMHRTSNSTGGFILLNSPQSKLPGLIEQSYIASLRRQYGSKASSEAVKRYVTGLVAHEVAHEFHRHGLSDVAFECAARYYQKELLKGTNVPYYFDGLGGSLDRCHTFFANLVREYGDQVHRYFLGSSDEIDPAVLRRIEAAGNMLFPDGVGL